MDTKGITTSEEGDDNVDHLEEAKAIIELVSYREAAVREDLVRIVRIQTVWTAVCTIAIGLLPRALGYYTGRFLADGSAAIDGAVFLNKNDSRDIAAAHSAAKETIWGICVASVLWGICDF